MAQPTSFATRLIGLQAFKEATWGASLPATAKLMAVVPTPTFTPINKSTLLDEQRNSLAPAFNKYIGMKGGDFSFNQIASYEELPRWMVGFLQGALVPTSATTVTIASSTNASPIEITCSGVHSLVDGAYVYITGHTVNTGANGQWRITYVSTTKFTLNGSVGVGVGGATGTVYEAPFTFTAAGPGSTGWNPQSYTLEHGYDIASIVAAGCLFQKFDIKGEIGKAWEWSGSGFYKTHTQNDPLAITSSTDTSPFVITTTAPHGYAVGTYFGVFITGHATLTAANGLWTALSTGASTFSLVGTTTSGLGAGSGGTYTVTITPGLVNRQVEAILMPNTILSADAAAGTIGTTALSNDMETFALALETGLKPVYAGGSLTPTDFVYEVYKATLTLNLLFNATVKATLATLFGGASMLFELKATSSTKIAKLQFSGALIDNIKEYTNKDGAICAEMKLGAIYDTGTFANFLKVIDICPVTLGD